MNGRGLWAVLCGGLVVGSGDMASAVSLVVIWALGAALI